MGEIRNFIPKIEKKPIGEKDLGLEVEKPKRGPKDKQNFDLNEYAKMAEKLPAGSLKLDWDKLRVAHEKTLRDRAAGVKYPKMEDSDREKLHELHANIVKEVEEQNIKKGVEKLNKYAEMAEKLPAGSLKLDWDKLKEAYGQTLRKRIKAEKIPEMDADGRKELIKLHNDIVDDVEEQKIRQQIAQSTQPINLNKATTPADEFEFDPIRQAINPKREMGVIDPRGLRTAELATRPQRDGFFGRLWERLTGEKDINDYHKLETKLKQQENEENLFLEQSRQRSAVTDKTWKINTSKEDKDWELSNNSKLNPKNTYAQKEWRNSVVEKEVVDTGHNQFIGQRMLRKMGKIPELAESVDTKTKLEQLRKDMAEVGWGWFDTEHPKFDKVGNVTNLPGGDKNLLIADLDKRIAKAESKKNYTKLNQLEKWKETTNQYLRLIEKN